MKKYKMIVGMMVALVGILGMPMAAAAQRANIQVHEVLSLEFMPVADGIITTQEQTEEGIVITTKGETKEGYLYLHQNYEGDWSGYNAFSMKVENVSDSEVRLSLHIQVSEEESMNLENGAIVLLKGAEDVDYRAQILPESFIVVDPHFKGEIIIPFSGIVSPEMEDVFMQQYLALFENVFHESASTGAERDIFLKSVASWGITILPNLDEEQTILIKQVGLVEGAEHEWVAEAGKYSMTGNEVIQIPNIGEVIADYKVMGASHEVYHLNEEEIEGVTIDENGMLTVMPQAQEQVLRITAMVDEGYILQQKVTLSKEWMAYETDEDGNPYYLQEITDEFAEHNRLGFYQEVIKYAQKINVYLWIFAIVVWVIYLFYRLKWKLNRRRR